MQDEIIGFFLAVLLFLLMEGSLILTVYISVTLFDKLSAWFNSRTK